MTWLRRRASRWKPMRLKTLMAAPWSVVIWATIFLASRSRAMAKACSISSRPSRFARIEGSTSTRSSAMWRVQLMRSVLTPV